MASEEDAPADGAAASADVAASSAGPSHDRAGSASTAAATPTASASALPPASSHAPPEPPAPPSAPATAPGSPFRAGAAAAPPAPALTLTRAAEAPGPPGPPPPLSLPAFPADFRAATAPAQLSRRSSQSQAVSESIGLLRTMRLRGGAGSPHADGALYLRHGEMALNKRMWKDGAEQLLVCLAYNDGDPRASHSFGSAVEHIRRDRPFWDPVVKPRQTLDFGGLVRTRTRRLADLDPVKSRPRPIRKIIDDFPEMWRLARMDETVRTRSGYVPHEELNELRGMFHKEYYIPVRNIFRYYARLDGAKVKAIAVRARRVDGEEMYTVNKREFDVFVQDCQLLCRELTAPKVNIVFISANKDPPKALVESMARAGAPIEVEGNNKLTMVLPEFMNAVVRLANLRYARVGKTVAERFVMLMERDVLPNARWDDVQEFRRLMQHDAVQAVVVDVRPTVRFLFERYRNRDTNATRIYGADKARSISIREYLAMFSDLGLLQDRALSQKDIQDAFATSQADPVIDDDVTIADDHAKDNLEELILPEFEEALLRCAVARHSFEQQQQQPLASVSEAPGQGDEAAGSGPPMARKTSRLPPVPRRGSEAAPEPEIQRAATAAAALALAMRAGRGGVPDGLDPSEASEDEVIAAINSFFQLITRILVEKKIIRPRRANAPLLTSASILRDRPSMASASSAPAGPVLGRPRRASLSS